MGAGALDVHLVGPNAAVLVALLRLGLGLGLERRLVERVWWQVKGEGERIRVRVRVRVRKKIC